MRRFMGALGTALLLVGGASVGVVSEPHSAPPQDPVSSPC
jgi:hypothetical protein